MLFELLPAPLPDTYGEALLPLAQCRQHLSIEADDTSQDVLVAAFRDAAIDFVEQYCGCYLRPRTGAQLLLERFPRTSADWLTLPGPNAVLTGVAWKDTVGGGVSGTLTDFRLGAHGRLLPVLGGTWPVGVGGGVTITFNAGYANNACPAALLQAARLLLGQFWHHREAAVESGVEGEVPFGVTTLCRSFRRVSI